MTKEDILGALPALERADLQAIHAMAAHLLGATGAAGAVSGQGASPIAVTIFDALLTTLGQFGHYSGLTPTARTAFDRRYPDLMTFLGTNLNLWVENKITQIAFLRLIFGLLADDLKAKGITPTVGIMVANFGRIPEIFNNAFPSYIESGMAEILLKKFRRS